MHDRPSLVHPAVSAFRDHHEHQDQHVHSWRNDERRRKTKRKMRLGVAMAVLATSSSGMDGVNAFGLSSFGSKSRSASRVGMVKGGWENDDFLSGLGEGEEKLQDANEAYWKQSQYETAMANKGYVPPQPGDPDYDDVPVVVISPEQAEQQAKRDAEMEEKARLYRHEQQQAQMQMMQRKAQEQTPPPQQQQQQQQQQPQYDYNEPPIPSRPPPQQDAPPSNRDAWQVANVGDLYLAQLKKDSTIRITARKSGDVATANAVMKDEEIDKMKDLIKVNPFLEAYVRNITNIVITRRIISYINIHEYISELTFMYACF
jgi:hypothetical protein